MYNLKSVFLCNGLVKFGIILFVVVGIDGDLYSCAGGWKLLDDQCYFVSNNSNNFATFSVAYTSCANENSTLASVTNATVYNFLWTIVKQIWSMGSCNASVQRCQRNHGDSCTNEGCLQFWIGLYKYNFCTNNCKPGDATNRQGWYWLKDNSTYDSTSGWNNWADNKPTGGQSAARIGVYNESMNGYFGDIDQGNLYNYICQRNAMVNEETDHPVANASATASTPPLRVTEAMFQADSKLTIGLAVGLSLGVLLIILIVVIVIIVKRKKQNDTICNFKNCCWKRNGVEETFKPSLQPWARETLGRKADRAYPENTNSEPCEDIDPYSTSSTRGDGDDIDHIDPCYATASEANGDVIDHIDPYYVHSPQPTSQPNLDFHTDIEYNNSKTPASNTPVYSVPDKSKSKVSPLTAIIRGIQKRFSSSSQDVAPVYSVPNKPEMKSNTTNISS